MIYRRYAWSGMDTKHAKRLESMLGNELPDVFRANRVIEQKSGYISESCKNNLVDVLSHIGTLAESGGTLNSDQQAAQVAKIEEHLRRAIMEAPEELVRAALVDIKTLWGEYMRVATPYRKRGTLRGVTRHEDLEQTRSTIQTLMESARKTKRDECSWQLWCDAAAHMTEAMDLANGLRDSLEQCIGEAMRMKKDSSNARGNKVRWGVGVLIAIGLFVAGNLSGSGGDKEVVVRPIVKESNSGQAEPSGSLRAP